MVVLVGCGGGAGQQNGGTDAACQYPANADTDDGSTSGCHAGPPAQDCQVSSGATINGADGGVTGGTESCKPLCSSAQYELTCMSAGISGPIPDPASSLSCQIIPGPTPSNALFYCCPCGN
jgi:hypothetical protein